MINCWKDLKPEIHTHTHAYIVILYCEIQEIQFKFFQLEHSIVNGWIKLGPGENWLVVVRPLLNVAWISEIHCKQIWVSTGSGDRNWTGNGPNNICQEKISEKYLAFSRTISIPNEWQQTKQIISTEERTQHINVWTYTYMERVLFKEFHPWAHATVIYYCINLCVFAIWLLFNFHYSNVVHACKQRKSSLCN